MNLVTVTRDQGHAFVIQVMQGWIALNVMVHILKWELCASQKHCVQMTAAVQGRVTFSQVLAHAKSTELVPTVVPCFALLSVNCARRAHQRAVYGAEVDTISRRMPRCVVLATILTRDVLAAPRRRAAQCAQIHC